MSVTYAYAAEIVKSERDANGDLLVYGKATGPDLDLDGQICDPSWLKSATPEWMTWGNVREMHQPIAAGVGVELEEIGENWWLKSKCIGPRRVEDTQQRSASRRRHGAPGAQARAGADHPHQGHAGRRHRQRARRHLGHRATHRVRGSEPR